MAGCFFHTAMLPYSRPPGNPFHGASGATFMLELEANETCADEHKQRGGQRTLIHQGMRLANSPALNVKLARLRLGANLNDFVARCGAETVGEGGDGLLVGRQFVAIDDED